MEAWRKQVAQRPRLVSAVLAVLFLPYKVFGSHISFLNTHAARDWERGWEMMHFVRGWWHGPELIYRGTIPGWFFNLLAGLFQVPGRNPFFAAMGPALLYCGAIFFFAEAVRRLFSQRIAIVSALAYGLIPLGTVSLRYVWNPSYLYIFTAFAFYAAARGLTERRGGWLVAGLGSLLLAGQIHLSGYFAAVGFVLMVALFRVRPNWKHWAILAIVQLIFIGPYFIYEAQHNWPARAAAEATSRDRDMDTMRLYPNPTFLLPFAMMGVHQPPLDTFGIPQTFPFSYFERFYQAGRAYRVMGLAAFVLSLPMGLLMVAGALRGVLPRRLSLWGEDDEARRRHLFVLGCLLYLVAVCLPQFLWNPRAQGLFKNHWGVPVRYLVIAWPVQFLFLAAALDWLGRRKMSWRRIAEGALAGAFASFIVLTVAFHVRAIKTGEPFNYVTTRRPVHALRDKVALMEELVTKYGLDEEAYHRRVHLSGDLLRFAEENLEYELRTALEHHPDHPPFQEEAYFFIHRPEERDRIVGEYEEIGYARFGGLAVLIYRPTVDLEGWELDSPVSWY